MALFALIPGILSEWSLIGNLDFVTVKIHDVDLLGRSEYAFMHFSFVLFDMYCAYSWKDTWNILPLVLLT